MGGSPDLVVMGGDSCQKIVGSNPCTIYWMDIFRINFCKNCNVDEKTKKRKRGHGWPIEKIIKISNQIKRIETPIQQKLCQLVLAQSMTTFQSQDQSYCQPYTQVNDFSSYLNYDCNDEKFLVDMVVFSIIEHL